MTHSYIINDNKLMFDNYDSYVNLSVIFIVKTIAGRDTMSIQLKDKARDYSATRTVFTDSQLQLPKNILTLLLAQI